MFFKKPLPKPLVTLVSTGLQTVALVGIAHSFQPPLKIPARREEEPLTSSYKPK